MMYISTVSDSVRTSFRSKIRVEFFETSNVSSGHSTHHQRHVKMIGCKRVLGFCKYKGNNHPHDFEISHWI
jgi:hypothetical protein